MNKFSKDKWFRYSTTLSVLIVAGQINTASARGPDLPVTFAGGTVTVDGLVKGYEDASETDYGNSVNLKFGLNALGFAGDMTVNAMSESTSSDFKYRYGNRLNDTDIRNGGDKLEIYNFSATNIGENYDTNIFYHVPRYHWGYEGDQFGLMAEATDMPGMDIWNDKAPSGIEFIGKGDFNGLKLVAGEEIYWGADPMAIAKYRYGDANQYTFMATSVLSGDTKPNQFSWQGKFDLSGTASAELGLLHSGEQHLGATYYFESGNSVLADTIELSDTVAVKARVTENVAGIKLYTEYNYAGLVADAGEHKEAWKTNLPHSKLGNKQTVEIGAQVTNGSWLFFPRVFKRINLANALSSEAMALGDGNSIYRRATDTNHTGFVSPFAVTGNREATSAEFFITYDPTPATFFYEWDNDVKEDADLAFNVGITRTEYGTKSDSLVHHDPAGGFYWIDEGRPLADGAVNTLTSRIVLNPSDNLRIVTKLDAGHQIPKAYVAADAPLKKSDFYSLSTKLVYDTNNIFNFAFAKNKLGEYDEEKDWGFRYPEKYEVSYERLLNNLSNGSKAGIQAYKRTMDEFSGDDYGDEENESMYELRVYFTYAF
jgi:beta-galactosidase